MLLSEGFSDRPWFSPCRTHNCQCELSLKLLACWMCLNFIWIMFSFNIISDNRLIFIFFLNFLVQWIDDGCYMPSKSCKKWRNRKKSMIWNANNLKEFIHSMDSIPAHGAKTIKAAKIIVPLSFAFGSSELEMSTAPTMIKPMYINKRTNEKMVEAICSNRNDGLFYWNWKARKIWREWISWVINPNWLNWMGRATIAATPFNLLNQLWRRFGWRIRLYLHCKCHTRVDCKPIMWQLKMKMEINRFFMEVIQNSTYHLEWARIRLSDIRAADVTFCEVVHNMQANGWDFEVSPRYWKPVQANPISNHRFASWSRNNSCQFLDNPFYHWNQIQLTDERYKKIGKDIKSYAKKSLICY